MCIRDRWAAGTLSPTRWSMGVAAVGDQVIFAGGKLSSPNDISSAAVDLYDSRTGTWSTASLSEPREEPGVAVVGTTAIIAGGVVRGRPNRDSEVVDVYD